MKAPLETIQRIADKRMAQYRLSCELLGTHKSKLALAKTQRLDALESQRIVQVVASTVQQRAHDRIAKVVSRCLSAVFPEPYEFRIIFEQKRGKTSARLAFVRDGVEYEPMSATAGGVIDVAAFALRLSCLLLTKPALRRVMILDEPFRFVSQEYRPAIAQLLVTLSEELKVQFIMVTHIRELEIGKVIRL